MPGAPGRVVSCEHAGRRVPERYAALFATAGGALDSHRGWDPGAATLARALGAALDRPPLLHEVTRLLVDVNRSPTHPACFSEFSRGLPAEERRLLLEREHAPHRRRVRDAVSAEIARHGACIHIGVHTFTSSLDGVMRTADIGLLYDPGRAWERALCARWKAALAERSGCFRIRRNYPYRGIADGLTTTLRRSFAPEAYAGIELEVRQELLDTPETARAAGAALADTIGALIGSVPPAP